MFWDALDRFGIPKILPAGRAPPSMTGQKAPLTAPRRRCTSASLCLPMRSVHPVQIKPGTRVIRDTSGASAPCYINDQKINWKDPRQGDQG